MKEMYKVRISKDGVSVVNTTDEQSIINLVKDGCTVEIIRKCKEEEKWNL